MMKRSRQANRYDEQASQSERSVFKIYAKAESPSEGEVFKMDDESDSPHEEGMFKILYDEPKSVEQGPANRNSQTAPCKRVIPH